MNIAYNCMRFISNLPFIRQIKHLYRKRKLEKRRQRFLNNGIDVLNHIDCVLTNASISYSVVFGTLLGAIREKGFIKHDLDIDIAVWYNEVGDYLKDILTNNGFTFFRSINVDGGKWGREETYQYNGISIDFFYFYDNKEYGDVPYVSGFLLFPGFDNKINCLSARGGMMPVQMFLPLAHETKYVPFETTQVPVPVDAENFLEARYGKTWRVPDPTFVYPRLGDVSCKFREDKLGIIEYN